MRRATAVVVLLFVGCSGPTRPPQDQSPLMARLWIDQVETYTGTVAEVCVRLSSDGNPAISAEEIGGMDLLLYYDRAALGFLSIERDSLLLDWEYWTYRLTEPVKPLDDSIALIRILASRDLDNGVDSPAPSGLPDGPLLKIGFLATSNWELVGIDSPVGFWRDVCNDNTIWSADDPTDLLIANMDYSPGEDYLAFDTLACARRLSLNPSLGFRSGSVHITEPPDDRPLAGDLNLDGQRFTIADAVLLSDFFVAGEFPWVTVDSLRQLEAGDCNADGEPFTIADLEFMVRVIKGEFPWWHKISEPNADTLYIWGERLASIEAYSVTASKTTSLFLLVFDLRDDWRPPVNVAFSDSTTSPYSVSYSERAVRMLFGRQYPDTALIEGDRIHIRLGLEWGGVLGVRAQASTYPGVPMAVVGPNPRL